MFSGIVGDLGTVRRIILKNEGAELKVHGGKNPKRFEGGESVAVNGVCLTVRDSTKATFTVDLSTETLSRTSFKNIEKGVHEIVWNGKRDSYALDTGVYFSVIQFIKSGGRENTRINKIAIINE